MKLNCLAFILLGFIFCTNNVFAEGESNAKAKIQVGASLNQTAWKRSDKSLGQQEIESSAANLDLSLAYLRNKWSLGLAIQGGQFEAQSGELYPGATEALPVDADIDISRVDLVFAYYFWPQVSLFTGFKNYTQKVSGGVNSNGDFSLEYNGIGVGVAGFKPVSEKWNLFASLSITPLNIEADNRKIGSASSSAIVFGGVYSFREMTSFSVAMKVNTFESDFDNGQLIENSLAGLRFGIHHQFEL